MIWQDEGYILAKNKFRENAVILEVFTKNFGKVSGIVYGGSSRKVKNYLQIANKIFIIYNSKNQNKIGYFKTELIKAISPKYFNNPKKIICLSSLSSILKILLPENEVQKKIYNSLDLLIKNFNDKNWLLHYLNWEIELIRDLGFGLNINFENHSLNGKKTLEIKVDDVIYKIPIFILIKKFENINIEDISDALIFSRSLMENKFFFPNNLRLPFSRKLLEQKIL